MARGGGKVGGAGVLSVGMGRLHFVIARSAATQQSRVVQTALDCFPRIKSGVAMTGGPIKPRSG